MIILMCGQCQMDMDLYRVEYYDEHGNQYRMKYILADENNHQSEIMSSIKSYEPDSAEQRLIQSLIDKTQRLEKARAQET